MSEPAVTQPVNQVVAITRTASRRLQHSALDFICFLRIFKPLCHPISMQTYRQRRPSARSQMIFASSGLTNRNQSRQTPMFAISAADGITRIRVPVFSSNKHGPRRVGSRARKSQRRPTLFHKEIARQSKAISAHYPSGQKFPSSCPQCNTCKCKLTGL